MLAAIMNTPISTQFGSMYTVLAQAAGCNDRSNPDLITDDGGGRTNERAEGTCSAAKLK